ncbi:hypothetical protein BB560_000134 [Smittium megazygosporum]|uniref:YbgI/family dinuclear metal center protein n=1 Tax=Smittium megazygosporum TaxID=133381 RepID=A0A2T9ZLB0_9FUNG|nr:hypothetical protein BB560_000132 [Smittium megazygosporum]PVV05357.1 hypothetical protein BB560_000134 [Smittium megazygosporum]
MALLSRVQTFMEKFAPLKLAAGAWDNVGTLLEVPKPRVNANKIFLTIDLTSDTLEEALSDESVGVIISYHPPIFVGWKSLVMSDYKKSLILKAAVEGVSIYSPHTALDSCKFGINNWLCECLGEGTSFPITPFVDPELVDQEGAGEGRILILKEPQTLTNLVARTKSVFGLDHVRVARTDNHSKENEKNFPIQKIAICAGSGSSVIKNSKVDLFFTGEMSHHDILAATSANISCILTEHSNSERGYLHVLKKYLEAGLNANAKDLKVSITISTLDRDPILIE